VIVDGCTLRRLHYIFVEQGIKIGLDMGHKVVKSEINEILISKTSIWNMRSKQILDSFS